MEILIPVDMQYVVEKVKKVEDKFVTEFKDQIKKLLPVGYELKIQDSYVCVYKNDDTQSKSIYNYRSISDAILYKGRTSKSITFEKNATANDVYRLCGLVQLLVSCDVNLLGDCSITKENH